MTRYIDADALKDTLGVSDRDIEFAEMLDEAPTIDAVPVIRCKECKNYYPNMEADGETGDCKKARWFRRLQYPSDYCSRAERKPPQVNPEMVKALKDRIEKQRGEDGKTN